MNIISYSVALTLLLISFGCSSSKLSTNEVNNKYGLTQEQYDYVKQETVSGGKLDFEPQFPDNKLVPIDGVLYNKKAAAMYTWAYAMKKLGVNNVENTISLYEELQSISLRDSQKKAMQNGFNK
jgi:hypothetical protein